MEKIEKWLRDNPEGYGYGSGYGSGSGYGCGDGYGCGSGYGDGYGCGYGSGYGSGSGYGCGDGDGYGFGYGSGSGYGCGDGDGYGYGIGTFNGQKVYMVDGIQTIIKRAHGAYADGYILNDDLSLTPCFIAKGHGYFAHGNTGEEAREALTAKIFENMDSEEAIESFMDKFKPGEKYPGTEFFEWHHYLTGSCLMGRESFVRNHNLDVNAMYTVDEFIALCENDYGSEIIKELKERWSNG